MALTMEEMPKEVSIAEPQLADTMEEIPKEVSTAEPQLAYAMEKPKEVSSEESSEPSGTKWWEPKKMVKVKETPETRDDLTASQGLSVIFQQVGDKKAKKTKQMKLVECSKDFKAVAERLSAAQEKKKKRKKRNKKNKVDWKVTKL